MTNDAYRHIIVLQSTKIKQNCDRKGGGNLSEREKEILSRITEKVPKLETNEQNYILGVVEGMALMKEQKEAKTEGKTAS